MGPFVLRAFCAFTDFEFDPAAASDDWTTACGKVLGFP
jgi:hypothetical protein